MRAKAKGAAAERELAALLLDELGVRLERRLAQCRAGGHDLELADAESSDPVARELARYAIEVKRYARAGAGEIAAWWRQAAVSADRVGKWPCVAYRLDRREWRVIIPLASVGFPYWPSLALTIETSALGFCAIIRERAA